MEYIKIPIKNRPEGIGLASRHFGDMMWRTMPNGDWEAYPYDNDFPVVITKTPQTKAEPGKE